jgi:hypothetical protein
MKAKKITINGQNTVAKIAAMTMALSIVIFEVYAHI